MHMFLTTLFIKVLCPLPGANKCKRMSWLYAEVCCGCMSSAQATSLVSPAPGSLHGGYFTAPLGSNSFLMPCMMKLLQEIDMGKSRPLT